MLVKKWKFPLREDHAYQLIICEKSDVDRLAKHIPCIDENDMCDKDGGAYFCDGVFTIILIDHTITTLVHECVHIANYADEHFSVDSNEFECMVAEWCFSKAYPILKNHIQKSDFVGK